MRHRALVLVVVAGCGGASKHAAAPDPASAAGATAARGAVEQWKQAWEIRSSDALEPLYSHDDLVVVEQGHPYVGWTAVEAWLQASMGQATAIHIQLDDLTVAPLGAEGAVANATMSREIDSVAGNVTEKGALTLALRREGERWVIVSEHYSHPVSVE
jgi:ketosteroid isomerase-like protein